MSGPGKTARMQLHQVLSLSGLTDLHATLQAAGFVLQPIRVSRRRRDGVFPLRLVWRSHRSIELVVTLKRTCLLRFDEQSGQIVAL
jgi:hypothetical protein